MNPIDFPRLTLTCSICNEQFITGTILGAGKKAYKHSEATKHTSYEWK